MSVHLENPVFRSSQAQPANVGSAQSQPQLSPLGMASEPSTLLSSREHVNADASGSFCACFENLINWFRDLFSNIFGSRSSATLPTTTVTAQPITGEQKVDKAKQYIDFHFNDVNTAGLTFPVSVLVVVRWKGLSIYTPMYQLNSGNAADLKNQIKEMIPSADSRVWELQNGDHSPQLEVVTCFFHNRSADAENPTFDIRRIAQVFDFRTGRGYALHGMIGVRGDHLNSNLERVASFLLQAARGSTHPEPPLERFQRGLFSEANSLPRPLATYLHRDLRN